MKLRLLPGFLFSSFFNVLLAGNSAFIQTKEAVIILANSPLIYVNDAKK